MYVCACTCVHVCAYMTYMDSILVIYSSNLSKYSSNLSKHYSNLTSFLVI